MNAIIYVFSGTGNTKKVCDLYKQEFEKNGVETTIYLVKAGFEDLPSPMDFDYVGFAYPIHGFNAPHIMLDLARKLQNANQVDKKRYFVLKSSGEPLSANNVSSYKFNAIMKRKGYEPFAEYHYVMPYNMIFRHTDSFAAKMYNTLVELAPIEARDVLAGREHKLKGVPFGHLFAWILRIEQPAMRINGKMFKVDKSKCIGCNMCVNNCPMHNITRVDGKFKFGSACVMCARCSFNCPTDAFNIAMLNGWRVNGKYNFRYDGEEQVNKHARYCKKAYAKYFAAAEEKIRCANQNIDVK